MSEQCQLYKERMKVLRDLQLALHLSKGGHPSPKTKMILLVFGFLFGITLICFLGLFGLRHSLGLGETRTNYELLIYFLSITIPTFYVAKYSKKSEGWDEEFDRLLNSYEPMSKEGFIKLQQKTKDDCIVDRDYLLRWAEEERRLILRNMRKDNLPSFVSRKM